MNVITYTSFVDELEKIAKKGVLHEAGRVLKKGWEYGANIPGRGWLGTGIDPRARGAAKRFEQVTSLGGLTRYLPVGPKSLTIGAGALSLPEALKKEDPTGQGRSRAERMGGVIGGTLLGIATAPSGLVGSLAGGIGGDVAGSLAGRIIAPRRRAVPVAPPASVSAPTPQMPPDGQT